MRVRIFESPDTREKTLAAKSEGTSRRRFPLRPATHPAMCSAHQNP